MKNIKEYNLEELKEEMTSLGEKPYRAEQIFKWIYKDKVKELIIEDGSVSSIEARAFTDSKTLQRVTIGNSVQSIGDEAFRGCSKLENVIFSSPKPVNSVNDESSASEWEAVLSIGANAFKTGSEYLTFHGDVHSGYAPFELAMSDSGFSSKSNMNICYKTDAPSHLTIIRDNETGMSTLIDYPHYEEVDTWNQDLIQKIIQDGKDNGLNTAYSITSKFEELNGWTDTSKYGQLTISNDENDIIANITDDSKIVKLNGSVFVEINVDNIENIKSVIGYISVLNSEQYIEVELKNSTQGKWYYFDMPATTIERQTYIMPKIKVIYKDGNIITGRIDGEFKIIKSTEESNLKKDSTMAKNILPNTGKKSIMWGMVILGIFIIIIGIINIKYKEVK